MRFLFTLVLGLTAVKAEEAPDFTPRFIVPAKLEYFPRMILDQVAEPAKLRSLAEELGGRQTADARVISITERPFALDGGASKIITEALTADEEAAKQAFKSMPLIGPKRVFALMNGDGNFRAVILDYRTALVITKAAWIGDGYIQADRSWSRAVTSPALTRILDLASKRPEVVSPFQAWMNGDRYHKIADSLDPKQDKQNRVGDGF